MDKEFFATQAMRHRIVISYIDTAIDNLEHDIPTKETIQPIRKAIEEFVQGAMMLGLAVPPQPPDTNDPDWRYEWVRESERVLLAQNGREYARKWTKKITSSHPSLCEAPTFVSLMVVARIATEVVRMVACGLEPDLLSM